VKVNWNQVVGVVAGKNMLDSKVERNVESIEKARHEFKELKKKHTPQKYNNKSPMIFIKI